MKAGKVDR